MIYFKRKTQFGIVCLAAHGNAFRTFLIQENQITMPHRFTSWHDAIADYDLRADRGF